jgi:sulfide dehydrogenase cytochrome subunit
MIPGYAPAALTAALLTAPCATAGAVEPSPALSWNCNGCHGAGGASAGPAVPSIAGMHPRYFFKVMREYKLDERDATIMDRIAKGYRTKDMRAMAAYFADREWVAASATADPEPVRVGERLHDERCAECHEDGGRYQDKEIPRLAGQWPDYLRLQMDDYRTGLVKLPQPDKMRERLEALSREEIAALAAFYAQVDAAYVANASVPDADDGRAAEATSTASE